MEMMSPMFSLDLTSKVILNKWERNYTLFEFKAFLIWFLFL